MTKNNHKGDSAAARNGNPVGQDEGLSGDDAMNDFIRNAEGRLHEIDHEFEQQMDEIRNISSARQNSSENYAANNSRSEIDTYEYFGKEIKMDDDIAMTAADLTGNKRGREANVNAGNRNGRIDPNDRVLVPQDMKGEKSEVTYVSLKDYKAEKGLDADALKADLDKKAILIKSESGTYLTKNQTYNTTYADKTLSKDEQFAVRNDTFKKQMDELGLSDKNFAALKPEKLTPETRKYETDGGTRRQQFNYENPVQAGRDTPDVLVRNNDGSYTGIWPKKEGLKTLEDATEKYGGRENVMLKTTGNSYVPSDTYNERKGPLAAEKAFAKMSETQLNLERPDMPKAFYKVADGVYAPKEKYDELVKNPAYQGKVPVDRAKTEILFQSPSGQGLVTGQTLKFLDKEGYAKTFKDEGLPEDLKTRRNVSKPEAMVYLEKEGLLISAERAKASSQGKPLDEAFPAKDIYLQNKSAKGEFTGNYADKESFERNNPKGVAYDRMATAGITESKVAARINDAYSTEKLLAGLPSTQAASTNTRQIDQRSRESAGRDGL